MTSGQEGMTARWGALWGYTEHLTDPKAAGLWGNSSRGISGLTRNSYIRHGKMPLLMKCSSLVHIIWSCNFQIEDSQGFSSAASATVSTAALPSLKCLFWCTRAAPRWPLGLSLNPPLSTLEKSHSLVVWLFVSPLSLAVPVFLSTSDHCFGMNGVLPPHPSSS